MLQTPPSKPPSQSEGLRFNTGKSRVDLIPGDALLSLGEVFRVGAEKYSERNWEKGMSWNTMLASMLRHTFLFMSGQDRDAETGLLHTQHIAWNALALLTYQLRSAGTDDRYEVPNLTDRAN
jgi:hypothetical protein